MATATFNVGFGESPIVQVEADTNSTVEELVLKAAATVGVHIDLARSDVLAAALGRDTRIVSDPAAETANPDETYISNDQATNA